MELVAAKLARRLGVRPTWPRTGTPARTRPWTISATSSPPSSFTASAPLLEEALRGEEGPVQGGVGEVGEVGHEKGLRGPLRAALVWWSISSKVTGTVEG